MKWLLLFFAISAQAQTIGLHLTTAHIKHSDTPPAAQPQSFTPGIYVLTEGKASFGIVRNSYKRTSFYAAQTWNWQSLDWTLGVITGYQKRRVFGPGACPIGTPQDLLDKYGWSCWHDVGKGGFLRPLAAISLPIKTGAYTTRFSLLGSGLHLSVEMP